MNEMSTGSRVPLLWVEVKLLVNNEVDGVKRRWKSLGNRKTLKHYQITQVEVSGPGNRKTLKQIQKMQVEISGQQKNIETLSDITSGNL